MQTYKGQPSKFKPLKVAVLQRGDTVSQLYIPPICMQRFMLINKILNPKTSNSATCQLFNYKTHGSIGPEMAGAVEWFPSLLSNTEEQNVDSDTGNARGKKKGIFTFYLKKQRKQHFNFGNF